MAEQDANVYVLACTSNINEVCTNLDIVLAGTRICWCSGTHAPAVGGRHGSTPWRPNIKKNPLKTYTLKSNLMIRLRYENRHCGRPTTVDPVTVWVQDPCPTLYNVTRGKTLVTCFISMLGHCQLSS